MTIKKQLLLTIILATIIPMLVLPWIGYFYIKNTMQEQLLLQSSRQLERVRFDMEDIFDNILKASNILSSHDNLFHNFSEEESVAQRQEIMKDISTANAAFLYQYNSAISLYDTEGRVYSTLDSEQDIQADFRKEWVENTIKNQTYFLWKSFHTHEPNDPILGMSRNIYALGGKRIGTLCIELFEGQLLSKILREEGDLKNTERYLIDESGNLMLSYAQNEEHVNLTKEIYLRHEQAIEEGAESLDLKAGDERYIFLKNDIAKTAWSVVQIVPYDEVYTKLIIYRNFTLFSNLVFLGILLLIDNYTANRIGKSLMVLRDAMKKVRKGNFVQINNNEKNLEVWQMYDDFNVMSTRLDALFQENKRIVKEKEQSRMLALQAQINPHFLMNTLNGIKWLCIIESASTAQRMIESLGYILEYSLGRTKEYITLEEEVTCLRHYVELQKMRYGNVFDMEYDIEKECSGFQIPVLILQPLVENSIIHGIADLKERGKIVVRARKKENSIIMTVADNGVGMSQELIKSIMEGKTSSKGSIGVRNVKERISLCFVDASFEIQSDEGKGTRIRIVIKVTDAKGEDYEDSHSG